MRSDWIDRAIEDCHEYRRKTPKEIQWAVVLSGTKDTISDVKDYYKNAYRRIFNDEYY